MLLHRYHHHGFKEQRSFANPHRGQGRVLALLKMQPEISQKELTYLLDMRNQSLSELLSKLEKAGYITRSQSETDRRVVDLKLTDAGREAASQLEQQKEGIDQIFECLNEEEQKNLSDYLERLIAELEKQSGEGDFFGNMHPEHVERRKARGMAPEMAQSRRRGHGGAGGRFEGRGEGHGRCDSRPKHGSHGD